MAKDPQLAAQAAMLRDLIGSPGWLCLKSLIEKEMAGEVDSLIMAESENARGRILGYKRVLKLPELYIQRSKAQNG